MRVAAESVAAGEDAALFSAGLVVQALEARTVPAEHAKTVHPGGGIIRAVALENGVAVGTWTRRGGLTRF